MNVCRAINSIKNGLEKGNRIAGLTTEEHEQLKIKLQRRVDGAAIEKEHKAKEREIAKSFREERKNRSASAAAKKRKRAATISTMGLADWHRVHYDPVTGAIDMHRSSIPGDMPRRFPRKQISVPLTTPNSFLIPGIPPKANGTSAGRNRIRVMQMD